MTIHIETLADGFIFQMYLIEGGTFDMGSSAEDKDAKTNEQPQRIGVEVAPFYIAPYVVTQALWKAVIGEGNNPSKNKGDNHPVETLSWKDTQQFIKSLNEQTEPNRQNLGLGEYRLPTEAEWEYAARGGSMGGNYRYAGSDKLKEVGWYAANSDDETREVGLLMPNQLGLYDISGNVWEWVEDHWHDKYNGAPKDSRAWLLYNNESGIRILRGGGYYYEPQYCRCAYCDGNAPDGRNDCYGFRLALSPGLEQPILSMP